MSLQKERPSENQYLTRRHSWSRAGQVVCLCLQTVAFPKATNSLIPTQSTNQLLSKEAAPGLGRSQVASAQVSSTVAAQTALPWCKGLPASLGGAPVCPAHKTPSCPRHCVGNNRNTCLPHSTVLTGDMQNQICQGTGDGASHCPAPAHHASHTRQGTQGISLTHKRCKFQAPHLLQRTKSSKSRESSPEGAEGHSHVGTRTCGPS